MSLARFALRGRAVAAPALRARGLASAAPKRESTFMRVWIKNPIAYPIFAILGFACGLATYKLVHDGTSPEYHFRKSERSTLDYVGNDRDADKAAKWAKKNIHRGPEFIRDMSHKAGVENEQAPVYPKKE
mmetsp:Transcript_27097/g.55181  ORF Transcript_27097/g.55181 Transcript_27097/m.55181 type:complete len:130 (-) Transcript_27097:7-396(-)